jgi:hypothetical protein
MIAWHQPEFGRVEQPIPQQWNGEDERRTASVIPFPYAGIDRRIGSLEQREHGLDGVYASSTSVDVINAPKSAETVYQDSIGVAPDQDFYTPDEINEAEAERLKMMAEAADSISLDALGEAILIPNAKIGDIGAGDSTTLGLRMKTINPTLRYLPVDIRPEAVQEHVEAGFDGRIASATDLPYEDASLDALHSRFTFGWLDAGGRERALQEFVRTLQDGSRLTIIDYDWSVAQGPEPVNNLIGKVTGLMKSFGFDPNYGGRLAGDLVNSPTLEACIVEPPKLTANRAANVQTLDESLDTIAMTIQPVIDKLIDVGLEDEADELLMLSREVYEYAQIDPDAPVRFPDIVSVNLLLDNVEGQRAVRQKIHQSRKLGIEATRKQTMVAVGGPELGTYVLKSDDMILQARRLHAQAYHAHGFVTDEAIQDDGTLIEEIDPTSTVLASNYIGKFNGEGTVTGNLRQIETPNHEAAGLPVEEKLREAFAGKEDELARYPFMQPGKKTFEASALGKSSEDTDKATLGKLLVAIEAVAKAGEYDYALMGVVEPTARLLEAFFGTKAFRKIEGGEDIVIGGKGIRQEGVKLVPYWVNVDTFLQDIMDFFDENPKRYSSKIHSSLFRQALPS